MNHKERNFSNTLKTHYQNNRFYFDKIESRLTTAGVPDLLVCSPKGCQRFIELKVVEKDYKIKLTPGQVSWHSKRHIRGIETPFIVLIEPLNKILVMSSKKAIQFHLEGGKIPMGDIPEQCLFNRTSFDYSVICDITTDDWYKSSRVYNDSWYIHDEKI